MNITPDDPRLTAYAVNELSPEERAVVDAALRDDVHAHTEIEKIRALGADLRTLFQHELSDTLLPEQRARIAQHTIVRSHRRWIMGGGIATAAAALLASVIVWKFSSDAPRVEEIVENKFDVAVIDEPAPALAPPDAMSPPKGLMHKESYGSGNAGVQPMANVGRAMKRPLRGLDDDNEMIASAVPPSPGAMNTEAYRHQTENEFLAVAQHPLSTFSIDVDTASYANVRRFLVRDSHLPPPDAVRVEEMINYFPYRDAPPTDGKPFAVKVEAGSAPWAPTHRLVRINLKGKEIAAATRPASNLVFLIDVSGSMDEPDKLPLLQRAMKLLVQQSRPQDRIAMVVYAGTSGLVLPSTPGNEQTKILDALHRLQAGGSTNGGEGITLAYKTARANFMAGGINRVVLATDGDFNVGVTNDGDLTRLIEREAKSGVYLSVLGFGTGNVKDATMEQLADKGNGNYAYIDALSEARKVLVKEMGGTLQTIAKDVKIQVEFNPHKVAAYRLIGYENRLLHDEDFNNDKKDAGEIGAGHTVTALYDVVPVGVAQELAGVDPLKYQKVESRPTPNPATASNELLTVKLRYKAPDGDTSQLLSVPVTDDGKNFADRSDDFRFAAAVAGFGMRLQQSAFATHWDFAQIKTLAAQSLGNDPDGYRKEFLDLVDRARVLTQE